MESTWASPRDFPRVVQDDKERLIVGVFCFVPLHGLATTLHSRLDKSTHITNPKTGHRDILRPPVESKNTHTLRTQVPTGWDF